MNNELVSAIARIPDKAITYLNLLQLRLKEMFHYFDPNGCSGCAVDLIYLYQDLYYTYLSKLGIPDGDGNWIEDLCASECELQNDGCIVSLESDYEEDQLTTLSDVLEHDGEPGYEHVDLLSDLAADLKAAGDIDLYEFFDEEFNLSSCLGESDISLQRFIHPLIEDMAVEDIVLGEPGCCCRKVGCTLWIVQGFPVGSDPNFYHNNLCSEDYAESLFCIRPDFLRSVARYELAKQNNNEERRAS